tara:strand:+ start:2308 stop:2565 length:258 start_codon:yes stop_codon:yes gene_type:complete
MIKFEVTIRPFFNELFIKGMKNMNEETFEAIYDDLDEWGGFSMFDKRFDYHFLYDEEPSLSIYNVDATDELGLNEQMQVKLTIEL